MLIDTIRREMIERHERQIAALIAAKPIIDAADRLEAILRAAGIEAHAVGHFNYDGCAVAVVTRADPQHVEEALILLGVEFAVTDATRIERMHLRALQVALDGQHVMMAIHHQPVQAERMAA